jgi:hypothetical protein
MRLMKGLRGTVAAWWALAAWPSPPSPSRRQHVPVGLHSYGPL